MIGKTSRTKKFVTLPNREAASKLFSPFFSKKSNNTVVHEFFTDLEEMFYCKGSPYIKYHLQGYVPCASIYCEEGTYATCSTRSYDITLCGIGQMDVFSFITYGSRYTIGEDGQVKHIVSKQYTIRHLNVQSEAKNLMKDFKVMESRLRASREPNQFFEKI